MRNYLKIINDHHLLCDVGENEVNGYQEFVEVTAKHWRFSVRLFNNIEGQFELDSYWTLSQVSSLTDEFNNEGYRVDEDRSESYEIKYHFINQLTSQCEFVLMIKKPNIISTPFFYSLCNTELNLK